MIQVNNHAIMIFMKIIHYLSQVKVEFLDYGGIESVAVSSLRLLPEKFTVLPFQGISSSLCSKSPPSNESCGWLMAFTKVFNFLMCAWGGGVVYCTLYVTLYIVEIQPSITNSLRMWGSRWGSKAHSKYISFSLHQYWWSKNVNDILASSEEWNVLAILYDNSLFMVHVNWNAVCLFFLLQVFLPFLRVRVGRQRRWSILKASTQISNCLQSWFPKIR